MAASPSSSQLITLIAARFLAGDGSEHQIPTAQRAMDCQDRNLEKRQEAGYDGAAHR